MIKRMTLLAKKDGTSTSDFRAYWAGPHAKLALCLNGITRYVQNRVDKVLWTSEATPSFSVDGIVELFFASDEAMAAAQSSTVGKKHIPIDEQIFLKGWTLCVVDGQDPDPGSKNAKVLVPFRANQDVRDALQADLLRLEGVVNTRVALNWTRTTARREHLWAEPYPPTGFIAAWFDNVADAHDAFEDGSVFRQVIEAHTSAATVYLIDQLLIR